MVVVVEPRRAEGTRPRGDGRAGRLPLGRRLGLPRRRRTHGADLVRVSGAGAVADPRVLRAVDLRHARHDGDGRWRRSHGDLPRTRADVGRGLRARGSGPAARAVRRGRAQIFPARRVRLGIPAVWHRARVWCHRHDQSRSDRWAGQHHGQAEHHVAGRAGALDRGICIQDRGGAVPHVGTGRLRRLAHTGDGVHGDGRKGGRVCGIVPRPESSLRPGRRLAGHPVVARRRHDDRR